MRISEFHLIRYGRFTNRSLQLAAPADAQGGDIHFIVGPNEAGKSTLRRAIGDWLFGIPMRTPMAFLHPMPELRLGGVLQRRSGSHATAQRLPFERTKGNKNTLRTPEDAALPDSALTPWLASLQRESYERMYGLGHDQLVAGGADILAASDDVGRLLFQSAAGIAHLGQTLHSLEQEADALWGPRKAGARLFYQARDDFEAASRDLKQHLLRARDWEAHHDALQATQAQLRLARQQHEELTQTVARLERIRRVAPLLQALDSAHQRRAQLLADGNAPMLGEDAAQVLASARSARALVHADLQRLGQETQQLEQALAATAIDHAVLAHAADITELHERHLQCRAHRTDMAKRAQEVHGHWQRVQELARSLGWSADADAEDEVRQRLPAAASRTRLARLLQQRAQAEPELRHARAQLADGQRQLMRLEQALRALPASGLHPALARAADEAQAFVGYDDARRELHDKGRALACKADAALAAMGLWRAAPQALACMLAPDLAAVQALQQRQRDHARAAEAAQKAVAAKSCDLREAELALKQLVRRFQPVSLAQVQQARQERDALWHSIQASPASLPDAAAQFEEYLAQADQLADARLERAQHEAERQTRAERLEHLQLELEGLQAHAHAEQAGVDQCAGEWQALAASSGLPALPLDLAGPWLQQRQAVLAHVQEAAAVERQLHAGDLAATAAREALLATLRPADAEDTDAPSLAECLRQARTRIHADDRTQGERGTLQRQIDSWQSQLLGLQQASDTALAAWDEWSGQWQTALAAAGYPIDATAEAVAAEIDTLQEMERLLATMRGIRSERIAAMQTDLDGLDASALALAAQLDPTLAAQPAQDVALTLTRRLQDAQQARARADELGARLARTRDELAAARQRQQGVDASLAPLRAAAGTDDLEALDRAAQRSDRLREIDRRIEAARQELAHAGDGYAEATLREQACGSDPDALKAELEALAPQAGQLVARIGELGRQHGSQQAALDALHGTSHAAQAEARRQEAIAGMADAVQGYLRLHSATRLLQSSIERFRQTRQGPLLTHASAMFHTLTGGSFDRLLVDAEGAAPRLIGVRGTGAQVEVAGMSDGSRDQLYLALRLAALRLQAGEGQALPFVADDLFINFDDGRTQAGLQVLGELSRHLQVIVLTHHEHLAPLAQRVLGAGLNVVRL